MNRRNFLKQTTAAIGTAFAYRHLPSAWARPASANDDVRVAVIGLGNKGRQHVTAYANMPGVRLAALCDVDPRHLAAAAPLLPPGGATMATTTDARRIIDRDDIDAVIIATPDHWHALLGVWACQAGKDVYVEKPVAHNVWEARQLIDAARKHRRIMQAGTQFRSDVGLREAATWLHEGHLGRPQWGHVVWYEYRQSIGRTAPYQPDWLDYDLYCGPAPLEPLTRTQLHYDWHWMWSTGTGDLCNSGIHAFDVCRWFAGLNGLPRRVMSAGGRFVWDDAGQTPNAQLTLLDYPEVPILIENRNLPSRSGLKATDFAKASPCILSVVTSLGCAGAAGSTIKTTTGCGSFRAMGVASTPPTSLMPFGAGVPGTCTRRSRRDSFRPRPACLETCRGDSARLPPRARAATLWALNLAPRKRWRHSSRISPPMASTWRRRR